MAINVYARMTKLTNVVGRVSYISKPERQQEKLIDVVGCTDTEFWKRLAVDCQTAYAQAGGNKENSKCCEAREVITAIPNEFLNLPADVRRAKMESLVDQIYEKTGTRSLIALHDSHAGDSDKDGNAHFHIIFSERQELTEPEIKIADRNVFLDENGIRKRTKKEILDESGELRSGCRIVLKGTILAERYFGDKNPAFKEKAWLYDLKQDIADWINEELQPDQMREVYDHKSPYLVQFHIGKNLPPDVAEARRQANKDIKWINELIHNGVIPAKMAQDFKTRLALSPDRFEEMEAIVAEVMLARHPTQLPPTDRKYYEQSEKQMCAAPRTSEGVNEMKKRQLREAYRQNRIIRNKLKNEINPTAQIQLKRDLKAVSAAIDRLRLELGYDEKKRVQTLDERINSTHDRMLTADERQQWAKLGRVAGLTRAEVYDLCNKAATTTPEERSKLFNQLVLMKEEHQRELATRQLALINEQNEAYKRLRAVRNAEWILDPRNRRKSLLAVIFAGIFLANKQSSYAIQLQIKEIYAVQRNLQRSLRAADQPGGQTVLIGNMAIYVKTNEKLQDMYDDLVAFRNKEHAAGWLLKNETPSER